MLDSSKDNLKLEAMKRIIGVSWLVLQDKYMYTFSTLKKKCIHIQMLILEIFV